MLNSPHTKKKLANINNILVTLNHIYQVIFEVCMALTMKISILWAGMLCNMMTGINTSEEPAVSTYPEDISLKD